MSVALGLLEKEKGMGALVQSVKDVIHKPDILYTLRAKLTDLVNIKIQELPKDTVEERAIVDMFSGALIGAAMVPKANLGILSRMMMFKLGEFMSSTKKDDFTVVALEDKYKNLVQTIFFIINIIRFIKSKIQSLQILSLLAVAEEITSKLEPAGAKLNDMDAFKYKLTMLQLKSIPEYTDILALSDINATRQMALEDVKTIQGLKHSVLNETDANELRKGMTEWFELCDMLIKRITMQEALYEHMKVVLNMMGGRRTGKNRAKLSQKKTRKEGRKRY